MSLPDSINLTSSSRSTNTSSSLSSLSSLRWSALIKSDQIKSAMRAKFTKLSKFANCQFTNFVKLVIILKIAGFESKSNSILEQTRMDESDLLDSSFILNNHIHLQHLAQSPTHTHMHARPNKCLKLNLYKIDSFSKQYRNYIQLSHYWKHIILCVHQHSHSYPIHRCKYLNQQSSSWY